MFRVCFYDKDILSFNFFASKEQSLRGWQKENRADICPGV